MVHLRFINTDRIQIKLLLVTVIYILSLNFSSAQDYKIIGMTSDLPDGSKVSIRNLDSNDPMVTTEINDNRFEFSGKVDVEPSKFIIRIPDLESTEYTFFLVDNSTVTIDVRYKKYLNHADITGGTIQNEQNSYRNLIAKKKQAYDSLRKLEREAEDPDLKSEMLSKRSKILFEIENEKEKYIKNNSNLEYAAYLIDDWKMNKPNSEVQILYNGLSDRVKDSKYGKNIERYLALSQEMTEGAQLKNFTLKDLDGNPVDLEFFREKYVYLDFWASWCGPCRKQHPELRKLYQEYKEKGFEIVSVSIDSDDSKWREAVEKDKLTWTNLIDYKGLDGDVAISYKVSAVPISYLIDPNGKLISRYFNGRHDLKQKLANLLAD
ncbi:AhpC/TSA family protein [Leeuwenhoekiella marinoflava]|uniref:AhpC/TSA family protein n=1 Tax=Leeuwenhoekiella marinoflava TaxID=988 RepID=UPI003002E17A